MHRPPPDHKHGPCCSLQPVEWPDSQLEVKLYMKQPPQPRINVSKNHRANTDTPAAEAPVGQIERARGNKYYTQFPGVIFGL